MARRLRRFVALLALAAAPAGAAPEIAVPLRVEPAPGVEAPAGTPLVTGVPFADGRLANAAGLRVLTDAGEPVPAQLEVRGSYPRSGHVRWLGVEFPAHAVASGYRLVGDGGASPAPATPLRVERGAEAFRVETGALRAEIPRRGGLLRRVWWRGRLVLDQTECNRWVTADGRVLSDGADPDVRAEVEREGPLHAVIRVDGRYGDGSRGPAPRWTARLHFHAGSPAIRIQHTFVWIGSAEALQVRELSLRFALAAPATRAAADADERPGGEAVEQALAPGSDLSLLQDRHWHLGHGESRFAVRRFADGKLHEIASGERAGSWVDASGDGFGVALVLRGLWRQFPKELRAGPGSLTASLWSSEGEGGILDLRPSALERQLGPVLVGALRSPRYRRDWELFQDPAVHDPTGLARTHELLLAFHDGDWRQAGVASLADAFDQPPRVSPDPEWVARSGVVGPLAPRDPRRQPEREARLARVFDDVARLVEDWGDYGFLFHGGGPHHAYEMVEGRAVALPWRYAGLDFGFAKAAWLAYLRGGGRRVFELAEARTRFLGDVVLCHADSPSRRRGDWLWWASGPTVLPWAGALQAGQGKPLPDMGQRGGFGFSIEHALYHHYLTGDERSLDVVREYAAALRAAIERTPGWPEAWVREANANASRALFEKLDELAVLHEQLGDPFFLAAARRLGDALLRPDDAWGVRLEPVLPGGPPAPYPIYLFYKVPHVWSYLRVLDGPERERAERAIVRTAEYTLRTGNREGRGLGLRMAHAFALTGDLRYLAFGRDRVEAWWKSTLRGKPSDAYLVYLSGVPSHAADALGNDAYLAGALADVRVPLPQVPVVWKEPQRPAADIVLWKEADRPLRLELVSHGGLLETPDGDAWPARWLGPPTEYIPEGSWRSWQHREVTIPADAAEGPYRIRLAWDAAATVLAADGAVVALVAPGGLALGDAGSQPWYFEIPGEGRRLEIFASSGSALELRDARGRRVDLPAAAGGRIEVPIPKPLASGPWSVRALRPAFFAAPAKGAAFGYGTPNLGHATQESVEVTALAAEPAAGFAPGRTGQGLRVTGDARLEVPARGLFTTGEGTIEFWLRPDWDSGALPERSEKGLLALDGDGERFALQWAHGLTAAQDPFWDLAAVFRAGARRERFALERGERLRWRPDAWVHVALVWRASAKPPLPAWLVYVDGQPVGFPSRGPASQVSPLPASLRALFVGSSGGERSAIAVDGVLDDLRISSVARYGDAERIVAFAPPERVDVDDGTLALFAFENDLRARAAGGPGIEADFTK